MQTSVFNPVQLHLLEMFSHMDSEQELNEVKQVLSDYYFKKVEQRASEVAQVQGWTPEILESMANGHYRKSTK